MIEAMNRLSMSFVKTCWTAMLMQKCVRFASCRSWNMFGSTKTRKHGGRRVKAIQRMTRSTLYLLRLMFMMIGMPVTPE